MTETKQKKGILITEKNREALEKMIEEGQKKARTRTITLPYIVKHLERVEKHLNIPKTKLVGTVVSVDPYAQNISINYRGEAMSTHFAAEYSKAGWRLIQVTRARVRSGKQETEIYLTDDAREALLRRMTTCVLD